MSHDINLENGDSGRINYRASTVSLTLIIVSLVVYIFTTTIQAQTTKNDQQDTRIATAEATDAKLSENFALLTQLVQSHDAQIRALQGRK